MASSYRSIKDHPSTDQHKDLIQFQAYFQSNNVDNLPRLSDIMEIHHQIED